ncbi:hypothetical protein G6F23_015094 [Rhizopus arrhizus]|nr:hypothetical protein G6F23_015094 [Rhizopus arrhizus]
MEDRDHEAHADRPDQRPQRAPAGQVHGQVAQAHAQPAGHQRSDMRGRCLGIQREQHRCVEERQGLEGIDLRGIGPRSPPFLAR